MDAQIESGFEERLRRARPANRPQYIRIQATYLLESPDLGIRETIHVCADSPIGRSGTSFTTELRLAEVILASGDAAKIPEAAELLDAQAKPVKDPVW